VRRIGYPLLGHVGGAHGVDALPARKVAARELEISVQEAENHEEENPSERDKKDGVV